VNHERIIVIYDGGCGLCTGAAAWIRRFDRRKRCLLVDLAEEASISRPALALDPAAFRRELHVVSGRGEVLTGFFAVRRLLWIHPAGWLPACFLHLPGAALLGRPLYRAIARNRHSKTSKQV
jgi:predicted DCC family thiol-disulfide oxidoreductase YuxK